jgi:hypothetical protein
MCDTYLRDWQERSIPLTADFGSVNRLSMIEQLAVLLSGELNEPICAAVSNAEACLLWLAYEEPDLAEVREAAEEMVKEARRAAQTMGRIRTLLEASQAAT